MGRPIERGEAITEDIDSQEARIALEKIDQALLGKLAYDVADGKEAGSSMANSKGGIDSWTVVG